MARAVSNLGMKSEAEDLLRLYEVRKRADYSKYPVDAESASDCVRTAGRLVEIFSSRGVSGFQAARRREEARRDYPQLASIG